jgi:hypothetical protein
VGTAFNDLAVISFKDGQGGVEQLAFGDDDDVEPRRDVVPTKNLSNQSFSSVSLNSSAELFRSCDAQTPYRALVGEDEHRCEPPMDAGAAFIDCLKLGAAPDALVRPEPGQVTRC